MDLGKNILPMSVKLPEKFAQSLYYYLIANVPTGLSDHELILKGTICLFYNKLINYLKFIIFFLLNFYIILTFFLIII